MVTAKKEKELMRINRHENTGNMTFHMTDQLINAAHIRSNERIIS